MTTMTTNLFATHAPRTKRQVGLSRIMASLQTVASVAAERRALARLDARLLADAGITATDAARETARAPWDLPARRT